VIDFGDDAEFSFTLEYLSATEAHIRRLFYWSWRFRHTNSTIPREWRPLNRCAQNNGDQARLSSTQSNWMVSLLWAVGMMLHY